MKEKMTSKERLLTAINGGIPDRVPCIPDFSMMIPARMTGKPFWEVSSWYEAYAHAARYFGVDGWYQSWGGVDFKRKDKIEYKSEITFKSDERIVYHTTMSTPAGDMWAEETCPRYDCSTSTRKYIKDPEIDFPKIKYLYSEITGYDASNVEPMRKLCGDDGIFCLGADYPGMQEFMKYFDGNLEAAVYAYADYPEIFDEWAYIMDKDVCKRAEILLDLKPDVLTTGGSGTLTLSNPELVRRWALPTIKKVTRMAKEAGIPTMTHSCGKSMAFLEMLANETDLSCINPLECPPMGDVDLAEVKRLYGKKMCLMGNLNTTEVMLRGTVDVVEKAAKKAIDDAGKEGGFLLSTGDQCGRDTPDENIFKLVEVAKS
jgi:uroporphyrinogen decarboxylase